MVYIVQSVQVVNTYQKRLRLASLIKHKNEGLVHGYNTNGFTISHWRDINTDD